MTMTKSKDRLIGLIAVLFVLIALSIYAPPAFAGEDDDCRDRHDQCGHDDRRGGGDQDQGQEQDQHQGQEQGQEQSTAVTVENAAAGGSAINDGNELSVNTVYEAQAPDVVLIPNNNTERCLRVWGLSFSNQSGGGGIGVPWRSKQCDYEAAADDAFAQGERELGWFWKCQNKSLYNSFKEKGESTEQAQRDCHSRMVGQVNKTTTIETLKTQLTEVLEQRDHELREYESSKSRITEMCNESKNRLLEACQK